MNPIECPECHYQLSESEKLLCMVPEGHYCPQCWALIPHQGTSSKKKAKSEDG